VNALEKVVDLLAAVVLLFLVPLLFYGGIRNVSRAMLAGQAGEAFLKRVGTAGEITLPVWEELEQALERYGCDGFEVRRERVLFEPLESGVTVERSDTLRQEELLEQLEMTGACRLLKEDRIWLTIYVNDVPTVYFTKVRTGAEGI